MTPAARTRLAYGDGHFDGYRTAMLEVLTVLEDGGPDAAREWIAEHLADGSDQ